MRTLPATARRQLTMGGMRGRERSQGGGYDHHGPDSPTRSRSKAGLPPHSRRFCGAPHQSRAARDGAPMGRAGEWWRSSAHLRPAWLARLLSLMPQTPRVARYTRATAYTRAARHSAHPPPMAKEGRGENTGRAAVFSSRHPCLKEDRSFQLDFRCSTLLQLKQRPSRTHAERRLLRS